MRGDVYRVLHSSAASLCPSLCIFLVVTAVESRVKALGRWPCVHVLHTWRPLRTQHTALRCCVIVLLLDWSLGRQVLVEDRAQATQDWSRAWQGHKEACGRARKATGVEQTLKELAKRRVWRPCVSA